MNRIPTILIHGTLGSGKTTLVQSLLESEAFAGSFVIENEFADTNVDATTLEDHGHGHDTVYSIAGGCICCSSMDELAHALQAIVSRGWRKPVIIETTGVASSVRLIQKLFLNAEFLEHFELMKNVYVIDLLETTPDELHRSHTLDVRFADLVVITKPDLAEAAAVDEMRVALRKISPDVSVVVALKGAVDSSLLMGASHVESTLVANFKDLATFDVAGHDVSYTVRTVPASVTKDGIERMIASLQGDPHIGLVRAKGYFSDRHGSWWHLEATRTQCEISESAPKSQAVLVFIGSGVERIHPNIFDNL